MYDVLTNCHVGIQPLPTMQSQPQPTKPINTTIGPSTLHVSTINHQPPTTIYQPSTTIYQPPTPIYQPPSINHRRVHHQNKEPPPQKIGYGQIWQALNVTFLSAKKNRCGTARDTYVHVPLHRAWVFVRWGV